MTLHGRLVAHTRGDGWSFTQESCWLPTVSIGILMVTGLTEQEFHPLCDNLTAINTPGAK